MKKLMIMAVAAFALLTVQAAAVDWQLTCGNMKDHTGAAFSGKYELYATGGDLASDLMVLAVPAASATFNKYSFTVDAGMTAGQEYKFYYVLTDSDNYQFTSAITPGLTAQSVGSTLINFGNQATATTEGNWSAAPEPTSGLMFLLGVGLMALRRRRA